MTSNRGKVLGNVPVDSERIVEGLLVFSATESSGGDATVFLLLTAVDITETRLQQRQRSRLRLCLGTRFRLGRHLSIPDAVEDRHPCAECVSVFEVSLQPGEVETSFRVHIMTDDAGGFDEQFDLISAGCVSGE
jgi:hypothetical protein